MAAKVGKEYANFDVTLSLSNPVEDYVKLVNDKMKADVIMPPDVYDECWRKISVAVTEAVWKMLFDGETPAQKEQLDKASELLKVHKADACFYQAGEYNEWIVKFRDELLKREMFDFWKNEVVEKELGPCWARDSDLFEEIEDPEPANFYKHANCEAPWLKKKKNIGSDQNPVDAAAGSLLCDEPTTSELSLRKISKQTALEDYKYNMEAQGDIDGDDEEAYSEIFAEARKFVWQFLFDEESLSDENSKNAAELLEEYKRDACFFSPYDYNDWIPKVRDELLKRKCFDFWQNVIVKKELGLCWAQDSDYFDDMEDPEPKRFYKVGNDFIKQHKK